MKYRLTKETREALFARLSEQDFTFIPTGSRRQKTGYVLAGRNAVYIDPSQKTTTTNFISGPSKGDFRNASRIEGTKLTPVVHTELVIAVIGKDYIKTNAFLTQSTAHDTMEKVGSAKVRLEQVCGDELRLPSVPEGGDYIWGI